MDLHICGMPLDPFEYPAMGQSVAVARAKTILSDSSSHSTELSEVETISPMVTKKPSFIETSTLLPDHDGIGEVSLPLFGASDDGNAFWASGTAVVIAPWLAMTARHVVEDYVERFGGTGIPSPEEASTIDAHITPKFRLFTCLALHGGKGLISLRVGRMWFSHPMDVALLELVPGSREFPKDHNWECPVLDLSPPLVGTSIAVMGYPNSQIERKSDLEPGAWNMYPRTSTGSVLEIHHERRDSVLLPFPSFRTNARFDGGMSGAYSTAPETSAGWSARVCLR